MWTDDDEVAERQIAASLSFYGGHIELLQIHNMVRWPERLRRIEEVRDSGQVSLVGATHWQASSFGELEAAMVTGRLDAIQIPYNPREREVEDRLLPLAAELGLGVLINEPPDDHGVDPRHIEAGSGNRERHRRRRCATRRRASHVDHPTGRRLTQLALLPDRSLSEVQAVTVELQHVPVESELPHAVVTINTARTALLTHADCLLRRANARRLRTARACQTRCMIRLGTVVLGADDIDRAVSFWSAVLGYEPHHFPDSDNGFTILVPPSREGTRVAVQRSEKPPEAHPRVHLDLVVDDAAEQAVEVERLVGLGATRVPWDSYGVDPDFVVLADPEGNRFCVVDASH